MAIYQIKAISSAGEEVEFYLSAPSPDLALERAQESGYDPILIKPIRSFATPRKSPLDARNLSLFFKMLGSLLSAGVPLSSALRTLADQFAPPLSLKIMEALNDIASGVSRFSDSLERQGGFPPQVLGALKAAEEVGNLDKVAKQVGEALGKAAYFRSLAISASTYPMVILSFAILLTLSMIVFIVPAMLSPILELGGDVPLPTKVLLSFSGFILSPFGLFALLGGVLALYLYARWAIRAPEVRKKLEELILRAPVFGPLVGYSQMISFLRVLALTLSSGLVLSRALALAKEAVSFLIYKEGVERLYTSVENGIPLNVAMEMEPKLWPAMVVGATTIGLESGHLAPMLNEVREVYEENYEAAMKGLSSALEPILLIVVGALVGGIMLAILLPYFSLINALGGGIQ
jgi:type IV pilus assembly protein PilC